jgi:hypothetical protein
MQPRFQIYGVHEYRSLLATETNYLSTNYLGESVAFRGKMPSLQDVFKSTFRSYSRFATNWGKGRVGRCLVNPNWKEILDRKFLVLVPKDSSRAGLIGRSAIYT